MSGFAPLIEGFLAFALTMLALTAAVSSIVGAVLHLRRRHARGLRDMVRLLYLRELVPLLGAPAAAPRTVHSADAVMPRIRLTIDTSAIVPTVREHLGSGASAASDSRELTVDELEGLRRAEFIFDMTFMPLPGVVAKLEGEQGAHDFWLRRLMSAEKVTGVPWYKTGLHLVRQARYWITLRYGLDSLKDDEFLERLASSDVGQELRRREAWRDRNLDGWDALAAHLLKKFQAIGGACSETFARHSRGWCVAVGFLLAFALNVDSLDLLNSYLTDPALRQQVIAGSESIQANAASGGSAAAAATLPTVRAELQRANTQLTQTAQGLTQTLNKLSATLAADDSGRSAAARADLDALATLVKGVETEARNVGQEVSDADRVIRGVTHSLTASFPIGWKRFPNCAPNSPDLRCAEVTAAPVPADALPWTRWASILRHAQRNDPDGFNHWLAGVLLTGFLLGLGTPFWVQAVSAAFSLRRWDQKKKTDTESGSGAEARTTTRSAQTT